MVKILIVDDDPRVCNRLAHFITTEVGYATFEISNPREVIPFVEKEAPHLVILDILMPELSGLDILREIKEKYGNTVKVIVVTRAFDKGTKTKAKKLGADGFIKKPWNKALRDDIAKTVHKVLGYDKAWPLDVDVPRILVADDEPEEVEHLKFFLERIAKCRVDTAGNGKDAYELMKANDYDLVILDIRMPQMTGQQVMQRIKKEKKLPDVLAITAYTGPDKAEEMIKEGAVDCVAKPFQLEEFKVNVKKILEKKGKYLEKGS